MTNIFNYVKVGDMRRSYLIVILSLFILLITNTSFAFWVWTPESNEWVNPKFAVKETPQEQLDYAKEFYQNEEYKEAIREYKKLLKHFPRSVEAPLAQFHIAETLEKQGALQDAFEAYQLVLDKYPFSDRSAEVVDRQYNIGETLLEGRNNQGKVMKALTGPSFNIIEIFRQVIKNAPYSTLAPQSQYKIGLYMMEQQMYTEARDEFEKLLNDYSESDWTKAAKYQIALADAARSSGADYDQKVTQAAVEEFNDFVEQYPDAELSENAKTKIDELRDKEAENNYNIAAFYEKRKEYKAAKIYYQIVVDDYTASPWSTKALNRIKDLTDK